jgi:hypothetical protein
MTRRRINIPGRLVGTTRAYREPYYKARERGKAFHRQMKAIADQSLAVCAAINAINERAAVMSYSANLPDDEPPEGPRTLQ